MAHQPSIFASMKAADRHIVRMRDVQFEPSLFRNYLTGTALDELLCSYKGLPKGVNFGGLVRDGKGMLVSGSTVLRPGDKVVVFCLASTLKKLDKYFR